MTKTSTLGDNETVWQYVCIIWLFLHEFYMNSMVVVVFYDSNYTKRVLCIIVGNGIHSIINHNDMNLHARASCYIKNADSQRRRRLDPDYRTQEQSSDRGQRSVKHRRRRCRCCQCWCPSVCKEFLCGKYDILSGVWLSVSCVCNEFLCITTLTVWQYVLLYGSFCMNTT